MASDNADNPEELGKALGLRVRRLRQQRDWSLAELGERAGMAPSTLSKVENGLLSLSYDRLLAVAAAFGLEMTEFLEDGEPHAEPGPGRAPHGRLSVERKGSGKRLNTDNCGYDYLCTRIRHKGITPLVVEIKARSMQEFGELIRHEGEEFIYVLSGRIELHTEFYGPEVLTAGDSAYIDSEMGHACISLSDEPAVIVNTMTSVHHIEAPVGQVDSLESSAS